MRFIEVLKAVRNKFTPGKIKATRGEPEETRGAGSSRSTEESGAGA